MTSVQAQLPMIGRRVDVDLDEVRRQPSGSAALALCATKAGLLDKIVAADLGLQEAVWSRIKTGQNSLSLDGIVALIQRCGNDAPLNWMLLKLNYDPRSLRRLESDTERELRETKEELTRLKTEREVEMRLLRDMRSA